jgi:putative peptidoglycan lipid II flippase
MAEDTQLTPDPIQAAADSRPKSALRRPGWLRLSHEHTAFSAMLLLMVSQLLSRVIGLVRIKVIAFLFGAGSLTDAYTAAFQLPDMLTYLLAGGTASITFITILSRYREQGREHEGERTMSIILSTMLLVLGTAIILGEIFAPLYVSVFLNKFDPETAALCVHMTRIVLPAQLCFFAGGVLSAVLLVRKQFAWQAVTPLIYSLGIILGGILLHKELGVSSLAVGALLGAICGPLLLNYYAAHRIGLRLRFSLNWSHPGLRDWVRMSIPLMIGVSLVSADTWILNYFASGGHGDIAKLNYAKTLFTTPMAILGQAAGAASMPFFAALVGQGKNREFASSVNRIVTRIYAFAFLLSGWMIGMAYPAVDLVLRGGSFHHADVGQTSLYFALFAGSLCFWSAQAIYARAFYAAGDTFTPMTASTVITAASIPIYWFLFHHMGVMGLAIASDCGIVVQTLGLAFLLHRKRLVSLSGLEYGEMAKSLAAAVVSFGVLFAVVRLLPRSGSFPRDLLQLACGTTVWLLSAWAVLQLLHSNLPNQLIGRFRSRRAVSNPTPLDSGTQRIAKI